RCRHLADYRRAAGDPFPDPRHRTRSLPRTQPDQCGDRHRPVGDTHLHPPDPRTDAGGEDRGLCRGRTRHRPAERPHHDPLHLPQRAAAHRRAGDDHHRHRHHRGGQPVLPRARPAAAQSLMGLDAQHRQELHDAGPVDVGLPRRRDLPGRARLQSSRRRAARRARPPRQLTRPRRRTMFTTRPEILGTFGVVTSTHWLASQSGMAMLERGGNAFDAAVAAGFVLQVVEPHLVGPGGKVPIVFHSARTGKTQVLCGQGTTPATATIERYRAEGLTLIPGNGLLASVIPGSFDAWMQLLRDEGSLPLAEVMAPAIHYAENGHPMLPRVANTIAGLKDFFTREWPTSAAFFTPGGRLPQAKK